MSYALVNRWVGGTKESYDRTVAAVHPGEGLPPGQLHHFAGPIESDWLIIAIWDSRESWERFRDETLMPAVRNGIDGGFSGPPESMEVELDTVRTGLAPAGRS